MSQDLTEENLRNEEEETPTITLSEVADASDEDLSEDSADDNSNYSGIDWDRLKAFQMPYSELKRTPSFVWKHRYRLQNRRTKRIYFECIYCHKHSISGGRFDITDATTAAKRHLEKNKAGHGYNKHGKIDFEAKRRKMTIVERLQGTHRISQAVANELIGSFSSERFLQAIIDWITVNNHPLREIETPYFRAMIAAANPDAEQVIWANHQTVRDHILDDYELYQPSVRDELANATSLIHVSFYGWTSKNNKHSIVGVCVHHLNREGRVVDYLLALPEHLGRSFGVNYADIVKAVLQQYNITKDNLGYFVTDNESKNDTCLDYLAALYKFVKIERRIRCAAHILNLVAQSIMFRIDKEAYENENANIPEEEEFLNEWRKGGPLGILFEILFTIKTPQLHQLFESYQIADNEALPQPGFQVLAVIKPVKTRWNSYLEAFKRAATLRSAIDSITCYLIDKYKTESASAKSKKKKVAKEPRYVTEDGLSDYDWSVINNYIAILEPLAQATKMLEARGKSGLHGAVWEVIPTFDWLMKLFEEKLDRVREATIIDYPDQEALEDHYESALNRGWLKLSKYYNKLDDTPVYYAATILHPQYKQFCQNAWAEQPDWLVKCDASFQKLWLSYKTKPLPSSTPAAAPKRVSILQGRNDHIRAFTSSSNKQPDDDEYQRWKAIEPLPEDHPLAEDPILYWWQERTTRPRLAKLALDILTIPATSDDCERAFSEAGDLLEPRQ